MAKGTVFELDFLGPRKRKDRPFSSRARIAVKTFTQDTADGMPIVSPACTAFKDFERTVDTLIGELKRIRKQAKRKFGENKKDYPKARKK